jgi:hypothetical protein
VARSTVTLWARALVNRQLAQTSTTADGQFDLGSHGMDAVVYVVAKGGGRQSTGQWRRQTHRCAMLQRRFVGTSCRQWIRRPWRPANDSTMMKGMLSASRSPRATSELKSIFGPEAGAPPYGPG